LDSRPRSRSSVSAPSSLDPTGPAWLPRSVPAPAAVPDVKPHPTARPPTIRSPARSAPPATTKPHPSSASPSLSASSDAHVSNRSAGHAACAPDETSCPAAPSKALRANDGAVYPAARARHTAIPVCCEDVSRKSCNKPKTPQRANPQPRSPARVECAGVATWVASRDRQAGRGRGRSSEEAASAASLEPTPGASSKCAGLLGETLVVGGGGAEIGALLTHACRSSIL
jgi:hypothetical protein